MTFQERMEEQRKKLEKYLLAQIKESRDADIRARARMDAHADNSHGRVDVDSNHHPS